MQLRSRIRACTWFLIVGLAVSGLTAIPIQSEMALGRVVLGDDVTISSRGLDESSSMASESGRRRLHEPRRPPEFTLTAADERETLGGRP